MPVSNDNQDYGKSDEKNKENTSDPSSSAPVNKLTSDDLKGKQQVDADIEKESDKPADQ